MRLSYDLFAFRALKADTTVGSRYYVSKTRGPVYASEAFKTIINQKQKRAQSFEVLVDVEILGHVLRMVRDVNRLGGMATCTIAPAGNWFAVRELTILGNAQETGPWKEHISSSYEFSKIIQIGFTSFGSMIQASVTSPPKPFITTQTVPIRTQTYSIKDVATVSIPCCTMGWKVNLEEANIDKVKYDHIIERSRPLYDMTCSIDYRLSKTNCPEIVVVSAGNNEKEVDIITGSPSIPCGSALAVLGARVDQPDGHSYVRVKKGFRQVFKENLKGSSCDQLSVVFEEVALQQDPSYTDDDKDTRFSKATSLRHSAGWKGSYTVYRARAVVEIDSVWYWLDTFCRSQPPNPNMRIRYLEL